MTQHEFPHMMPEDVPVWRRWLDTHDNDWDRIDYDVHVGEGVDLPPDFAEPHRSNAIGLSKKRIDAVLIYPDKIVIVEVKKLASWKALGQTLGYPILYEEAFTPTVPISPLLVTESFTLDLQHIFDIYQLNYDLVPAVDTTPDTVGEPL